ncbi:MAG: Uma2 family endonuclease [Desulfamplus sp.]|nr:Uma2 family endonuclease [Desulfamplus sp.]
MEAKMIAQEKQKMTPEDYLEFEKNSELKHEYFDGEIFAMVGARKNHNRISSNVSRILGNQLLNRSCDVFISDMRVKIAEIEKYTYPDIVVACDKIEFIEEELDSLLNPVVIIEILSDSTESYDRGLKFTHYRLIESLQEYILISQYHCQVERFKRDKEGTWVYSSVEDINLSVKIDSINCELVLSEVYHRVEF